MRKIESVSASAHLAALTTVLIWGTTFIATKVLLRSFSPVEILFLRFALGFLALSLAPGRLGFHGWRAEGLFLGAGFCGVTLYFLLENIALQYTLAGNVGVIVSVAPFFTALLSRIFLREERLSGRFFAGLAIALSGVALLSFNSGMALNESPFGDILAVLAALAWAAYSVFMKKIGFLEQSTILCTRRVFLYGIVLMAPALWFFGFDPSWRRLLTPVNGLTMLFLGLGASALCFAVWNWTVKIIGAVRSSVYIYLVPVVSVAASALILREPLTVMACAGIVLALFGLAVSEGKWAVGRRKCD